MLAVADCPVTLYDILNRRAQVPFVASVDENRDGLLHPPGPHAVMRIPKPDEPVPKGSDRLGWHPLAALALRVCNEAANIGAKRELAAEMGRVAIKVYPKQWGEVLDRSAPRFYVSAVFMSAVPEPNIIITRYPNLSGNFKGAAGVLAVSISEAAATMRNRAKEQGIDLAAFFRGSA
jgi:hypothetical protein